MKCCITEQDIVEADIFAWVGNRADNLVVSQAGAKTLPEDMRRPPFLDAIARRRANGWQWAYNPWTDTCVFVMDDRLLCLDFYGGIAVDEMKSIIRRRIADNMPKDVWFHVTVKGRYEFSIHSSKPDTSVKVYEWVFAHPTLRQAASKVLYANRSYDSRHGVWVLWEGPEYGLSNRCNEGLLENVEQAEQEIRKIMKLASGYKYHVIADGRYVKTVSEPVTVTVQKPRVGEITVRQTMSGYMAMYDVLEDKQTIGDVSVYACDAVLAMKEAPERHETISATDYPGVWSKNPHEVTALVHFLVKKYREKETIKALDEQIRSLWDDGVIVKVKEAEPETLVIPKITVGEISLTPNPDRTFVVKEDGEPIGFLSIYKNSVRFTDGIDRQFYDLYVSNPDAHLVPLARKLVARLKLGRLPTSFNKLCEMLLAGPVCVTQGE